MLSNNHKSISVTVEEVKLLFIQVFVSRSHAHLQAVFAEYATLSQKGIEGALKSEFSGWILEALLAIVACVNNPALFFAEKLKYAMKGAGTDDRTLIRIIVSRCEVDMGAIKHEFHQLTGKSLESWVEVRSNTQKYSFYSF
ncbi:unnamed protein product [Trichobilharzia regenti]|nr:unnamed protein product [Trichobilharzia regenti]